MISLHIIVDNADSKRIDRGVEYLKNTKQKIVNIAGGSQVDKAMQLAERVRREVPDILVMFRILEDTGNIFKQTPAEWFNDRIKPRLQWLKEHKIVFVVDNESSGDDATMKRYVEQSILRAKLLHEVGLNGAFCRFATGNIQESQYALLKPLLNELNAGDWVSPNEYTNAPGKSSAGHLERYKRIQDVSAKPLNFCIGEAGIAVDYNARAGYKSINLRDEDMAAQIVADEIWYKGGTITRCVFAIGGNKDWETFQIGDGAFAFWEDYHQKMTQSTKPAPIPVPVPPPVPIPPPKPAPIPVPTPPPSSPIDRKILESTLKKLKAYNDELPRLALRIAAIHDDVSGDIAVLEALLAQGGKNETPKI